MPRSLNFRHLEYFYVVAREGGIARACERLHLTPQTVSGQISQLEDALNVRLFERRGRGLVMSEMGRVVYRYAEQIFNLGEELGDALRGTPGSGPLEFHVGVLDCIPKTIAYKLLRPALQSLEMKIICREGPIESILSELAVHKLDMVLADMPLTSSYNIRAYNHELGESGISFFAGPDLAKKCNGSFPAKLHNAPMLMPTDNSTIRRSIMKWFDDIEVTPRIVGEFDDSALLKSFGHAGVGLFFLPTVIENEIRSQYNVKVIGRTAEVREKFYAISPERSIKHPAVAAICDSAREQIFSSER